MENSNKQLPVIPRGLEKNLERALAPIKVSSENELRLKEALRQSCLNHAAKLAEVVNVYPA